MGGGVANSQAPSLEASNPHFSSSKSTPLYILIYASYILMCICTYMHIDIFICIHILYIYFKYTLKKLLPRNTNPEQRHTYTHTYIRVTHTQLSMLTGNNLNIHQNQVGVHITKYYPLEKVLKTRATRQY